MITLVVAGVLVALIVNLRVGPRRERPETDFLRPRRRAE